MDPLEVLSSVALDWAPTPDDVWRPSPYHVDRVHGGAERRVLAGIDSVNDGTTSPLGIAILGQRGAGKTHLLGWVRHQAQLRNGYFHLVTLHDGVEFWSSTLHCVLDGLNRIGEGTDSQLAAFLRRLAALLRFSPSQQDAIAGDMRISAESLDIFIGAFRSKWPRLGMDCQDTVRALVLYASRQNQAQDVGNAYLQGREETTAGERAQWGIQQRDRKPPQWLVQELFRLLALTGPSVVAVDQIDALVSRYGGSLVYQDEDGRAARDDRQLAMIANGLMDLRELTSRSLCVVACLQQSWQLIKKSVANTAADRFRTVLQLRQIPSPEVGEALIAKRLAIPFAKAGFTPPYPTWPVKHSAFAEAVEYTPRRLIQVVDAHITACLSRDLITELTRLDDVEEWPTGGGGQAGAGGTMPRETGTQSPGLSQLDDRFAELRKNADVSGALLSGSEDAAMPPLIAAGLAAWIDERGAAAGLFSQDGSPRGASTLHGRLRRTLNEELEDEIHWGFRAISSPHARAALVRLQAASGFVGLHEGSTRRRLLILRNTEWSKGPKTQAALRQLEESGGRCLKVAEDDLAVFDALRRMREERHPDLPVWLASRQPASNTRLLKEALGDEPGGPLPGQPDHDRPDGSAGGPILDPIGTLVPLIAPEQPRQGGDGSAPTIRLGTDADMGGAVDMALEALRKHTAIFAGSGSGKTVVIRRLIEECALQGVSSIVLDPNNDLARLGDPWPKPPASWEAGDEARAQEYLAATDVVVWTPRRAAGRPLSFQPLPDFAAVRDDPDELAAAIDAAVATLAPKARVDGNSVKAERGQAVLREALTEFAGRGRGSLSSYVEFLANLPDGVSALTAANKLAEDLSQTLTAAMVNDPLFGGIGTPVDPGALLAPPPGKRARVSVISFIGLPTDEQRQSFTNQLQMALFSWIKRHPAGDRPLGGLFVMDEAQTLAPSGPMTACTKSTIALASQARKYGLGLVFATQAPKALHNRIPGNAATQLFGFLNSPAQITAAKEMALAKSSAIPDISRLRAGEFYLAAEGSEFQKIRTPLCLSYHPRSPLSTEEVLGRASVGR
jgi:hypothetical protein